MKYKHSQVDGFVADTNTKALDIHANGKRAVSHGMQKIPMPVIKEEADALSLAIAEFMVDEFGVLSRPEIEMALLNSTDDIYSDWITFATLRGIESADQQAAGWEMIYGNEQSMPEGTL